MKMKKFPALAHALLVTSIIGLVQCKDSFTPETGDIESDYLPINEGLYLKNHIIKPTKQKSSHSDDFSKF